MEHARREPARPNDLLNDAADRLIEAERSCVPIAPLSDVIGSDDIEVAYRIQAETTARGMAAGRRLVGRKIGLTSKAVQAQMGVDQPDYGALFADMEVLHRGTCPHAALIQPRVEAEIAVVIGRDLPHADIGMPELLRAIEFAVPALEIVDSRIADWKISIVDTIADNGSSARFVIGLDPRRLTDLDLFTAGMVLTRDEEIVSVGSGGACLGHPMNAALWLARAMALQETPLKAGDLLLTGALGPMVAAERRQRFEARIGGFSPVSVRFD